jgi:tetratricopeptide (TPR) repeat protein
LVYERLKDTPGQLKFIATLAQMHINRSEYDAALLWSEKALRLAEKTNNKNALADIHMRIGWTCLYIAQYHKALENLQQSELLARETNQRDIFETALHLFGRVHAEMGNFVQALNCFRGELQYFRELNATDPPPFVWLRGGAYLLEMGEIEEAKQLLLRGMHSFQESEHRGGIAVALRGLARVELNEGNITTALNYLKEALPLINYQRGEMNIRQDLAEAYFVGGHIEEANQLLSPVIHYYQVSGEPKGLAAALYLKGQVLEAREEFEQGLMMYQESVDLFEAIGCLPSITNRPKSAIVRLKSRELNPAKAAQLFVETFVDGQTLSHDNIARPGSGRSF